MWSNPRTATKKATSPEAVLDAKLHEPTVLGAGDLTERRRADLVAGLAEADRIQRVEDFDAKLKTLGPCHTQSPGKRHVDAVEARAADDVAGLVANRSGVFWKREPVKATRVEPLSRRSCAADVRTARHVG